MSRTKKGAKGSGYEYWTARPGNESGGYPLGKETKKRTHKAERKENRKEANRELKNI